MWYEYLSLGTLIGSFAGVILAFILNYMYQWNRDRKMKVHYKELIKSEINKSVGILSDNKGRLLPLDRWASLVNTGVLKLFPLGVSIKLSDAYQDVRNYNYEAKRTRDIGERYRSSIDQTQKGIEKSNWENSFRDLIDRGKKLLHDLENLKNDDWFK